MHINRYLDWYESFSNNSFSYNLQNARLERIDTAIRYLQTKCKSADVLTGFLMGLKANSGLSPRLLKSLTEQSNVIKSELGEIREHLNQEVFYIPDSTEWSFFYHFRDKKLNEAKDRFKRLTDRAVLTDQQQAQNEYDTLMSNIKNSSFYENVTSGIPLYQKVIRDEAPQLEVTQDGWIAFVLWVHNVDYTNWLFSKIEGMEPELPPSGSAPLLQWEASVTVLYNLFFDLLQNGVITWNGKSNEGEKMEVARMLTNHFVNSEGKPLSIEMIKKSLKPGTPRAKK